ncbi:MAG: hypothetical protein HC777_03275 [Hyphomonadaceae bacterium]|nr:hypothetical protein [Hyphomonadaceae bacterium]
MGAILYEGTCANQRLCSPNKLWEYPAAGLPILATNLPYLGQQVLQHHIGFVVDEPLSAAHILKTWRSISPEALVTARKATATFSSQHDWESQAAIFVQAVNRAASNGQGARPIPE